MQNVKDALLHVVNVVLQARDIDRKMAEHGYTETPYGKFADELTEAIYALIGEHTETLEDSTTFKMLTAPFMDNERRAACLAYIHDTNFCQPQPDTISPEEMKKMHQKNGGYLRETPEGDWS